MFSPCVTIFVPVFFIFSLAFSLSVCHSQSRVDAKTNASAAATTTTATITSTSTSGRFVYPPSFPLCFPSFPSPRDPPHAEGRKSLKAESFLNVTIFLFCLTPLV